MKCVYLQLNTIKGGEVNSRNANETYPMHVYTCLIYVMYQGAATCRTYSPDESIFKEKKAFDKMLF